MSYLQETVGGYFLLARSVIFEKFAKHYITGHQSRGQGNKSPRVWSGWNANVDVPQVSVCCVYLYMWYY